MSEENKKEFLEIYNKGKARIKYGREKTDVIEAGENKGLEKETALKLIKMYPKDLTSRGDIALVDISKDALDLERENNAKLKIELKKSEEIIEALKKELLETRTLNNKLKKDLEDTKKEISDSKKKIKNQNPQS